LGLGFGFGFGYMFRVLGHVIRTLH